MFLVSANTNSWRIALVVFGFGVLGLASCAQQTHAAGSRIETESDTESMGIEAASDTESMGIEAASDTESMGIEAASDTESMPRRVAAAPSQFGSLEGLPRSLAPLGSGAVQSARSDTSVFYEVGVDSVEPMMLTNEAVSLAEFLEARARPVLPRFELRAPMGQSGRWSESGAGSFLGERFNQSGAVIGAAFDESGTSSDGTLDRVDKQPWVSAVDELRWSIGTDALDVVGITPEELGFPVLFAGPNGRKKGTTFTFDRRIEVYISEGDTVRDVAHVLAHEFGHALDVSANSPEDRYRWLVARGLADTTSWWPSQDRSDLTTGAGDFAECFASWRASVASRSLLAGSCHDQFPLLEELWERAR